MKILFNPRKELFMGVFVVLIVCVFLASSAMPSLGQPDINTTLGTGYSGYSTPLILSNVNSTNPGSTNNLSALISQPSFGGVDVNTISLSPVYKSYVYAATGGGDKPFSNPDYNVSLSTSDSYTQNASLIGISSSDFSTVVAGDTDYFVAGIGVNSSTYRTITYQNSTAGGHELKGSFNVDKNSLVLLVSAGTNEANPVITGPFNYSSFSSPMPDMGILYAYSILNAGVYNFSLSYTLWGNSTDYAASTAAAIYIFNNSSSSYSTYYSEILSNSNITGLSVDSGNTYFAASTLNPNGTGTLYYFNADGSLIWESHLNGTILQISLSTNGSYVVASYGNVLSLFNGSGKLLWSRVINGPVSGSYIDTVSVSSNGNYIAAGMIGPPGEPYGAIYLFSNTDRLLWNYTNGTSSYLGVHTVQISSNGKYVIMSAGNGVANGGYLALFNINGSIIWNISTSIDPSNAFFTSNNSYIVSTAWNTYVDGGVNGLLFYGLNGTLIWQSTLGLNDGPAPVAASNGDGYIGVGSNGNLTYFSNSGNKLWNRNLISSQSTPFLVSMTGGSNILISSHNNTVNIFGSNGSEISGYNFTHSVTGIQLFSFGNKLLVGTEDGLYIGIINTSTATYSVSFTESGLPSGTSWYVTLGSLSHSSTSSTISFTESDGTYFYTVGTVLGYSPSPSSGTVVVNGGNLGISITYSKNPGATLIISVSPINAVVSVNGILTTLLNGQATITLSQGYYYINASLSGYHSFTNMYDFKSGLTYYANITLSPLSVYGYLKGTISPESAIISASGVIIPVINHTFSQSLYPGTYYVSATASGYSSAFYEVNISQNNTSYLNISLVKSVNSFHLSGFVAPHNASVIVGEYMAYVNSTGYYQLSLPSGSYTISVTAPGYYSRTANVTLDHNIIDENFSLAKLPGSTSKASASNVTATGYNVTINSLQTGNGSISISYTATANGTLTITLPYNQVKNVTVSELLNSRVYVNGIQYKNFTVAMTTEGGNYSIILTVTNLSGDPTLTWLYSPTATLPPSPNQLFPPISLSEWLVIATVAVALALGVTMIYLNRRK